MPGNGSRSPSLQFGQVKILTPSRYSALLKVDEKGDGINQIEYEEVLSMEEEVITVEFENESVQENNMEKRDVD